MGNYDVPQSSQTESQVPHSHILPPAGTRVYLLTAGLSAPRALPWKRPTTWNSNRLELGTLTLGHVHNAHCYSGHSISEEPGSPAVLGQPTQRGQPC